MNLTMQASGVRQVIWLMSLLVGVAGILPASDIPVEGDCGSPVNCPPFTGLTPLLSLAAGSASALAFNFATQGTFGDPWLVSLDAPGTNFTLLFAEQGASALTSPSSPNDTGTGYAYGQYIQFTLTNSGQAPWGGLFFDLQDPLGTMSNNSIGFAGSGDFTSAVVQSVTFSDLQVLDNTNALQFSGGVVLPGQTATFLIPITDGDLEGGPSFFWDAQIQSTPEPSSFGLTAIGFLSMLTIAVLIRRAAAKLRSANPSGVTGKGTR